MNDTPYELSQFIYHEFQVIVNEDDLKKIENLNDLIDTIHERVITNNSGFTHGFIYERIILEKLEKYFDKPIMASAIPEKEIPKKDRIQQWEKLSQNLEVELPVLQYPPFINKLFSFTALLLTLGVLLACTALVGLGISSGLIFISAIFTTLLAISLYHFTGSLRTFIPFFDFKTLSRGIFLLNKKNINSKQLLDNTPDLKGIIKEITLNNFSEERLKRDLF